jgi:hypothetical protein
MSRAATSILVFSFYLIGMGLMFVFAPKVALEQLSVPPEQAVWGRCMGVLLVCIAYYYIVCARAELTEFFRATVYSRFILVAAFVILVAMGDAPWLLLIPGAIDLAGALWTMAVLPKA